MIEVLLWLGVIAVGAGLVFAIAYLLADWLS